MIYTTRRARIEAERAEKLALRSRRNKKFSMGLAGLATAASASVFGLAPANAALDDAPAPASSTSSTTSNSAGTYTVQSGDTLSKIAAAQGVSLDTLMSANNLSTTSVIYPGDVLQLSGDSSASANTDGSATASADAEVGPNSGGGESDVQPASHVQTASVTGTGSKAAAIDQAVSIVNSGASYQYGANGPSAYDCSAFTKAAFAAAGIDLPRVSSAQFSAASSHDSLSNVQAGDLVFWSSNGSASGIYHVAVYVGDGKIAQARNPQAGISIDSLDHYKQYNAPMDTVARY